MSAVATTTMMRMMMPQLLVQQPEAANRVYRINALSSRETGKTTARNTDPQITLLNCQWRIARGRGCGRPPLGGGAGKTPTNILYTLSLSVP